MCVCVCVCACVCVKEREREREREYGGEMIVFAMVRLGKESAHKTVVKYSAFHCFIYEASQCIVPSL